MLFSQALVVLLIGVAVLALTGATAAFASYTQLANSLKPRLDSLQNRDTFETSRIYDRNGTLLYEFLGSGKRTHVPISAISPMLINATVSIEDKTFFKNAGFDPKGILNALYKNATSGGIAGGGSTITQQLVKRVVLSEDERIDGNQYWRKVKEVVLAQEMTKQYSKQQVLDLYLNEIYYGNLSYGIEAASEGYFGVHAKDLSVAQAALLAGLPQLPSAYDPMNYLDGDTLPGVQLGTGWYRDDYPLPDGLTPPKRRQIAVMSQLVDEGYVPESTAHDALAQDLKFAPQERPLNAPHFVFYIRKLLEDKYGQEFANQGLSIYTTLDLKLQNMVQTKAKERIDELGERNINNAAVVVMQPNTGQVLAMVGSIDYNSTKPSKTPGQLGNVLDGQVNVAIRDRQPGSALKPFTYLSAMERGATPATVWWDVKTDFLGINTDSYSPTNYNGRWNGPLRIRTALANSLNMPAVKALKFAGLPHTLDLLHRVGITGLQKGANFYGLSLTLGGGEVTPLDLTTAYNTLASGGHYYPPVAILKVVDAKGTVLPQFAPPAVEQPRGEFDPAKVANPPQAGEQVLDPNHVAIITDVMADDKAREPVWGLGSKLKLSRPAAVKTGTTNDWRDAWAVGFTPYVTVGVWTGNNNNEPTAKVESITSGGVIWHNVMEAIFADTAFQKELSAPYNGVLPTFTLPSTVVRKPICKLPGPFNNFGDELFSPDMLKLRGATGKAIALSASATITATAPLRTGDKDGCDVYAQITVANLGTTTVAAPADKPDAAPTERRVLCRVIDGVVVPPELISTIKVWRTPKADPDEHTVYTWQGGGEGGIASAAQIPACTAEAIAAVAPSGTLRMPNLRGLGENQAKEKLAALGFSNTVFVQYQDRSEIGDEFDRVPAYAVVSSLPAAGTWVGPDELIFLGVRAPDSQPAPAPEQPTPLPQQAAPGAEQPLPASDPPTPAPVPVLPPAP